MDGIHGERLLMSDLEHMTGIGRSTIHYYIRKGLLSPPLRTGKTMAYYRDEHVRELRKIRRLREQGYPLSIISKKTGGSGKQRSEPIDVKAAARGGRRQQVMDTAVKVFAQKGYHRARISDITGALGISHSTFYLYFPSKKQLLVECVDETLESMFSDVIEEIKHETNPISRLRKRGEVAIERHPEFIDVLSVLRSTMDDDPRLEDKRKEIYRYIALHVKGDLDEAVKQGIIAPIDTEMAAYYLVIGLLETAALFMGTDESFSADRLMDSMEFFFLASRRSGVADPHTQ